jgi:AAA domain, putative AbiEii toxin, Type IV TA system
MRIRISVSNYRCFPAHPPAEFEIGDGVTAFVGENNAGKSAAMRLLHDLRPVFERASTPEGLNQFFRGPIGVNRGSEVRDPNEMFFNGVRRPITLSVDVLDAQATDTGMPIAHHLTFTHKLGEGWRADWPDRQGEVIVQDGKLHLVDSVGKIYNEAVAGKILADASSILSALRALSTTAYIPSDRLMVRGAADSFDVPVGQNLIARWDELQSGLGKEGNDAAATIENSLGALFGLPGLRAIPTLGENTGIQFSVRDLGQFRTDEVGTGLAQAFAAIFVAVTRKPSIILIDEPELSLHPTLQLRFLAELQRHASLGLVFSTHNLGLALNAADRPYVVSRQPGTKATVSRSWSRIDLFSEAPDLTALLGSLSYPAYGDLQVRNLLLVEGPTDARAYQLLVQELGVAEHVIVMHMGGNTTINPTNAEPQLASLRRLCPRLWCLIDSEADKDGHIEEGRLAFLGTCTKLDIQAHATRRRALENYLTDAALKARFGERARALQPYEKIGEVNPGWTKQRAWLAVGDMSVEEFGDVGDFLTRMAESLRDHAKATPRVWRE